MLHQIAVFIPDAGQAEQGVPVFEDAVHQIVGDGFKLGDLDLFALLQGLEQLALNMFGFLVQAADPLLLRRAIARAFIAALAGGWGGRFGFDLSLFFVQHPAWVDPDDQHALADQLLDLLAAGDVSHAFDLIGIGLLGDANDIHAKLKVLDLDLLKSGL